MQYGDRRDYAKIDIYVDGYYRCSTTWAKDLKIAREKFLIKHPEITGFHMVTACYGN